MVIRMTAWTRQFPAAMVYTIDTATGEVLSCEIDRAETQRANDSGEMHAPDFWDRFPETVWGYDLATA